MKGKNVDCVFGRKSKMAETKDIILSIKPIYWDLIKSRKKTVEFRRKWVKDYTEINRVFIYVSSPIQKIAAMLEIDWIVDNLHMIWNEYGNFGGISKEDFDKYFEGQSYGHVLIIKRIEQITLIKPSLLWPWWKRAPQNFMYVKKR